MEHERNEEASGRDELTDGRRDGQTEGPQRLGRHLCRIEVITVRTPGCRYPNQEELCRARSKVGPGRPTGRRVFFRFACSLVLLLCLGTGLLLFGFSFIAQAKIYENENGSSVPVVFCILTIVLGILMYLIAIVIGHYIYSRKLWRKMRAGNREERRSSSSQALHRRDSTSSLTPPDPDEAPPLYSVSHHHALAPPLLHFPSSHNASEEHNTGDPLTPEGLFAPPSYEEVVNKKVPYHKRERPPAYQEHTLSGLTTILE